MSTENRAIIDDVKLIDLLARAEVTSIAVATTGTAYSDTFQLQAGRVYSFDYQATSDGTVEVAVTLEQSNRLPTTESAADLKYVVPEDAAAFDIDIGDELAHIKAYAPAATKFARLKFVGAGSNHSSTVISRLVVSHIKG